jgi:hypothetical protein
MSEQKYFWRAEIKQVIDWKLVPFGTVGPTSWDDFCDFILAVGDSEIRDTEQANENQRTTPSTN